MPLGYFVSGGWGFYVDVPDDYLSSIYPLPSNRLLDVCVHITYWHHPDRLQYLERQINALNGIETNLDIFVHTNLERIPLKSRFNTIHHDMTNEYGHYLSWKHRSLMESQIKNYDVFIYMEDDLLLTQQNWDYWLTNHQLVKKYNSYIGYVRVEHDNDNEWYPTDITPPFGECEPLPRKMVDNKELWVNTNNFYNGFWILDNIEMQKFMKHSSWDLTKCTFFGNFVREKPAIGPIPLFKEVLLDLNHPGFAIHHMPNNYVGHEIFCKTKCSKIK